MSEGMISVVAYRQSSPLEPAPYVSVYELKSDGTLEKLGKTDDQGWIELEAKRVSNIPVAILFCRFDPSAGCVALMPGLVEISEFNTIHLVMGGRTIVN